MFNGAAPKRATVTVLVAALVCSPLYLAYTIFSNHDNGHSTESATTEDPLSSLASPHGGLESLTVHYNSLVKDHREALRAFRVQHHELLKFKHSKFNPDFHFFDGDNCPSPKVAVASMTRHNSINSMSVWIDYYFSIGFCHVFLRIQHSEYLRYMIQFPKYKGRISPIWIDDWPMTLDSNATKDEHRKFNTSKRDWQTTFVDKVIKVSLEYKLDWLLQVDDDELLHLYNRESVNAYVDKQNSKIVEVHFGNTESIVAPPTIAKEYPPFQYSRAQTQVEPLPTTTDYAQHRFVNPLHYKTGKGAYGNGKSIGRVTPILTTNGVHFLLTTKCHYDNSCANISYAPIREEAVVLHFECPDFLEWISKYGKYRVADFNHVPFGYYRDSVKSIREAMSWHTTATTLTDKQRRKAELDADGSKDVLLRVDIQSGHDDSFYDLVPHSYKEYKGLYDLFKWDLWDIPD